MCVFNVRLTHVLFWQVENSRPSPPAAASIPLMTGKEEAASVRPAVTWTRVRVGVDACM